MGSGTGNHDSRERQNKADEYGQYTDEYKDEQKRAEKVFEKNNKHKKKKKTNEIARAFALVTQLGVQMSCCIAIGVVSGIFLDRLLGTAPLFIITLSILSSAAAIKILYDISKNWRD